MPKTPLIHEGESTILYQGPDSSILIQHFKDEAASRPDEDDTAVAGKGVLNNRISMFLMSRLDEIGVPTHVIQPLNMREQMIYALEMLPLKVVVRNFAAGNMCKRLGIDEGDKLPYPIVEFFHTDKKKYDGLVNGDHIELMEWADEEEVEEMTDDALRINDFLTGLFLGVNIRLVDFKLEFGRFHRNEYDYILVLGDVLTPDTCRLADLKGDIMDKDGKLNLLRGNIGAYQTVARRLGVLPDQPDALLQFPKDTADEPALSNVRKFRKKKMD